MDLSQSVGPCPVCRSCTYDRTDMGFLVCEYGHQSQSVWQEEQDDFDTNTTTTGRRLKKPRPRPSSTALAKSVQPDTWQDQFPGSGEKVVVKLGEVDRYNVLLALQYILRAQVRRISRYLNLPLKGIEEHARRIWLIFINTIGIDYDEEELLPGENAHPSASNNDHPIRTSTPSTTTSDLAEILFSQGGAMSSVELALNYSVPRVAFGRTFKTIENVQMNSLLAILYLAMVEANVPLLVVDIKRMIIDRIIIYADTGRFIPPLLRRELEIKRWSLFYKGKTVAYPSTDTLTAIIRKISFQLANRAGFYTKTINTIGILQRYCNELSLPDCFISMANAMVSKYGHCMRIDAPNGQRSFSPELVLLAGLLFFLKTIYAFDCPKKCGYMNVLLTDLGLPLANDLIDAWTKKQSNSISFHRLPLESEFPWDRLDDYLEYCKGLGMLKMDKNKEEGEKDGPEQRDDEIESVASIMDLRVFIDEQFPWKSIKLTASQRTKLGNYSKVWTGSPREDPNCLTPEYRLLIQLASDIIDFEPGEVLGRIIRQYEKQ